MFRSGTTPTTVRHGSFESARPNRMRRPMGLPSEKWVFAKLAFTTATGSDPGRSESSITRPCSGRALKMSKNLDETAEYRISG